MAKELRRTASIIWLQDQHAAPGRFTKADGLHCSCPHQGCGKDNQNPAEGVEAQVNETTPFERRCQHCCRLIYFALRLEHSEEGADRAYLTARDSPPGQLKPLEKEREQPRRPVPRKMSVRQK